MAAVVAEAVAARLPSFHAPGLGWWGQGVVGRQLPLVLGMGPADRGFWEWLNFLEFPRLLPTPT